MRPFIEGESLYNVIRQTLPEFAQSEYPQFVTFITTFLKFLEQKRTLAPAIIFPEFGGETHVSNTIELGGPAYEARRFLEYRDVASSLDEFNPHFQSMFAENWPQHTYISNALFTRSLRQFYQAKGTPDSFRWFFRVLFNEEADVYFPREDILKSSDGTWDAPITLKVSSPLNGRDNTDVTKYYIGQRIVTETGSALVERILTNIVGQAFNQHVVVNELFLKFDSLTGFFLPGQIVVNTDSLITVQTTILPVIADLVVTAGGSNYAAGDIIEFSEGPSGGYGYGAFGTVKSVASTAINKISVFDGGDGYITGLPVIFTSASGTGATAVISEVIYGDMVAEDGTDGISFVQLELQTSGESSYFQLEDKNTLDLELLIFPFVNDAATVTLDTADYGISTAVLEMDGTNIDTALEVPLAATDEKPFMNPWTFTNFQETNAALANASVLVQMTTNTFFSNGALLFTLNSPQDLLTNGTTAAVTANIIVSDVTIGNTADLLYLDTISHQTLLVPNQYIKQAGNGIAQQGTIGTEFDGSANVVGANTLFSLVVRAGSHLHFSDGTEIVVKNVANDTFLTAFGIIGTTLTDLAWDIIPVGQITSITPQAQRFYGKIKTIKLLTQGHGYTTPPIVSADSISARAQEFYYFDPTTSAFVGADGQIHDFSVANLAVIQAFGQIVKINIIDSGVNYTDANNITIQAIHSGNRSGDAAQFEAVIGALGRQPGQFTSTRGFLSSNKYLEDESFYNDYTYVIKVGESFNRYKDLLFKLLHPAGFRALGQFVSIDESFLNIGSQSGVFAPAMMMLDPTYTTSSVSTVASDQIFILKLGDTKLRTRHSPEVGDEPETSIFANGITASSDITLVNDEFGEIYWFAQLPIAPEQFTQIGVHADIHLVTDNTAPLLTPSSGLA